MIIGLLTVIVGWGILFCVIAGLGHWIKTVLRLRSPHSDNWFSTFWIGYTVLIGFLEIWHLFLPTDWRACAVLGFFGGAGFIRALWQRRLYRIPRLQVVLGLLALIPIAVWLASRALDSQLDFDTGMYHLATLRWLNEYPVVPGIGNLHYRLAFNQSFFSFVAALNVYPYFTEGIHFANSLLMIVLVMQLVTTVIQALCRPKKAALYHLFSALLLPIALYRATHQIDSANMSSASPDLSIFILQMVVLLAFVKFLYLPKATENDRRFATFFIVTLSVIGVTSKLSFVMFGAVMIALILLIWLWTHRADMVRALLPAILWLAVIGFGIGLPWLVNGLISSGYPLFPSTFGALQVDYRVPEAIATDAADWVRSFARDPHGDRIVTMTTWNWLPTWWYLVNHDSFDQFLFVVPLQISEISLIAFVVLFVITRIVFRRRSYRYRAWLPILPGILASLFWFWSAPDPRFAGSAVWLLAAWGIVLLFTLLPRTLPHWIHYSALISPIGCAALILIAGLNADFPVDDSGLNGRGFPPLPRQLITQYQTDSGLLVNVSGNPNDTLELWDAPLPASPYKLPGLELRGTDLKDGFRMQPGS